MKTGVSCYFDDNQRKNWKAGFLGEIKKAKAAVVLMTPGYTECKECRTELVQIFNHLDPLDVFVVSVEETSLQGNFLGIRAGQVQDAAYVLARMANDVYPSVGVFTDTQKVRCARVVLSERKQYSTPHSSRFRHLCRLQHS